MGRLQARVIIAYSLLVATALIILGALLSQYFTNHFFTLQENSLEDSAWLLATQFNDITGMQKNLSSLARKTDMRLTVIDAGGQVLAESFTYPEEMEDHSNRPEMIVALTGQVGRAKRFSTTLGEEYLYVAVPVYDNAGTVVGVARTSLSLAAIKAGAARLQRYIYTTILALLPLLWGLGYLIMGTLTRSLTRLADRARSIGKGDFSSPTQLPAQDEVGQLEQIFNEMSHNLSHMVQVLHSEKERTMDIIRNLPVGVVVIDRQGKIKMSNPLFYNLLGTAYCTEADVHLLNLTHETEFIDFVKDLWHREAEKKEKVITLRQPPRHLQLLASPLMSEMREMIIVLQDMTRVRKLETMRRDFVANVSHELRTPLTAIQGFAETLAAGAYKEEKTALKFIDNIEKEARRLSRLIDDLLTLSRLESTPQPPTSPADLKQAVLKALSILTVPFEERQIDVHMDIPAVITVMIDEDDLIQVVLNLVSNAVNFAPPGTSVELKAGKKEDRAFLAVTDHGPGIPPEDQPRIFERFYRVDKGRSRRAGGTGLGLSIVKHILARTGGEVGLVSTPGKGSTFTILLPLAQPGKRT